MQGTKGQRGASARHFLRYIFAVYFHSPDIDHLSRAQPMPVAWYQSNAQPSVFKRGPCLEQWICHHINELSFLVPTPLFKDLKESSFKYGDVSGSLFPS